LASIYETPLWTTTPFITLAFMLRVLAIAVALSCLASSARAQPRPPPEAAATQAATPAKPAAAKPTQKARTDAKPAGAAEIGHCQIGVIPIAGNLFTIQKLGPIALSDTSARAGAEWGLDELVVARVRAAAPGAAVRRIVFSREELARGNKPIPIFGDRNSNLNDFIRKVTTGTNCERYVVVHRRGGGKSVFGIGIVKFVNLIDSRTFLFALMQVQIYDGPTLALIKEGPALIDHESLLVRAYVNPVGGPYRALDERSFPASREEAVANPVLRDGVRALLTASLDKTLPTLLRR
jgi:hypothetical protein